MAIILLWSLPNQWIELQSYGFFIQVKNCPCYGKSIEFMVIMAYFPSLLLLYVFMKDILATKRCLTWWLRRIHIFFLYEKKFHP